MNERKDNWMRNFLIAPLFVGLLIAIVAIVIPKILEKGKEITYIVEGPTLVLKQSDVAGVAITVNGLPAPQLFIYKIYIKNTGGISLKNVPIRAVLNSSDNNFRILGMSHTTIPPFEFGEINESILNNYSRRYVYSLLNPGNQATLTLITNSDPPINIYANIDGVEVKQSENEPNIDKWRLVTLLAIIGVISSVLSTIVEVKIFPYIKRLLSKKDS